MLLQWWGRAVLVVQLRGKHRIADRKIILGFCETDPRGAISYHIHPHFHSCPGRLDSQPHPCVSDRGTFISRKWATVSELWTLIRWDWALSPLTGLHLKFLVFFANNLRTVFAAQKPFGAYCPPEEVTQSIIRSAGFANCDLVQFFIWVKDWQGEVVNNFGSF